MEIRLNIKTDKLSIPGTIIKVLKLLKISNVEYEILDKKSRYVKPDRHSIEDITLKVFKYNKIPIESIDDKTRKREIVECRQIAHYFSKKYTKKSLAVIGLKIGKKDHATVLHSCKTVNDLIDTDIEFRNKIKQIEKLL